MNYFRAKIRHIISLGNRKKQVKRDGTGNYLWVESFCFIILLSDEKIRSSGYVARRPREG
jgi:hypothetical protein